MPLYEYHCSKCGVARDIRHGFDETTEETCQECGGALTRAFKPAGIVFKGSGFYVTDSRKSNSGTASSGSASDSAPKSESKGDSKSETPKADAPKGDAPKSDTPPKSDAAA